MPDDLLDDLKTVPSLARWAVAEIKLLRKQVAEARDVANALLSHVCEKQRVYDDSHGIDSQMDGLALMLEMELTWLEGMDEAEFAQFMERFTAEEE